MDTCNSVVRGIGERGDLSRLGEEQHLLDSKSGEMRKELNNEAYSSSYGVTAAVGLENT